MTTKDIYFKEVCSQMPRILNLLNRNPSSRTYGSFDRDFWLYNTFDISCARKQEAVLTLALMYKIKRNDNIYYNNTEILRWVNASLNFWTKIQNKDGSFDELYPNEHSFVATAFTCYAISEVLLLLKNKINRKDKIIKCLKKAGNWLLNHDEKTVFNQEAGAAIALYNIHLLTNERKYLISAKKKITLIIKNQTKEGWFYEYGGADIGYLSLCIDYLSKYYKKTKDEKLLKSLIKAIDFIALFVHPNYTFGGEYSSRNTEYMIPHGFEILSNIIPLSKAIKYSIREAIKRKCTISPKSIDDRYLLFNSYTYLQAYLDGSNDEKCPLLPYKRSFTKILNKSGFFIQSNKHFYVIANLKKGGALKIIFKKNLKSLDDSGIIIEYNNRKKLTSNWISENKPIIKDKEIIIRGKMWEYFDNLLPTIKLILFRIFLITFGKSSFISLKLKKFLRDKVISKTKQGEINFTRKLKISGERVNIIDEIDHPKDIKRIIISSKKAFIYGESSRYFQISDLDSIPIILTKNLNKKDAKRMIVSRIYNQNGKLDLKFSIV